MSTERTLYHTCFTRNDDGTPVSVNLDSGQQCKMGMTEDTFWDRKLYNELRKNRVAKKVPKIKRQKSKGNIPL